MGPNVDFEKENVERENESSANVTYDLHDDQQTFQKRNCSKDVQKRCVTKYKTGPRHRAPSRSSAGGRTASVRGARRQSAAAAATGDDKASAVSAVARSASSGRGPRSGGGAGGQKAGPKRSPSASGQPLSRVQVSAKCYDVRRGRQREKCRPGPAWQRNRHVRDECGSGIVPTRYDFLPSRRIWCKTPLSMYQATIGELARKILCREKLVPRDVRPAPPCNIEEYILPPCRGYYRRYDCLRPCEEDYAQQKAGKKTYRDRVARYWEPCCTQEEKYKLDINEYAPQNAFLSQKLRRNNMRAGDTEPPCW